MSKYYQPEIETASKEQIRAWQDERLVNQDNRVWNNVPYYRKKMEEKGVAPDDIKGVADLHKLPFLTKDDLREAYPYGLLGTDLKDCVRIQSTSGTTGKRVVAFYTKEEDICCNASVWGENACRQTQYSVQVELTKHLLFDFKFCTINSKKESVRNDNCSTTICFQAVHDKHHKQIRSLAASHIHRKVILDACLGTSTIWRIHGNYINLVLLA